MDEKKQEKLMQEKLERVVKGKIAKDIRKKPKSGIKGLVIVAIIVIIILIVLWKYGII